MKIPSFLSAAMTAAVFALPLAGCGSSAAPLPEVRYFVIADT